MGFTSFTDSEGMITMWQYAEGTITPWQYADARAELKVTLVQGTNNRALAWQNEVFIQAKTNGSQRDSVDEYN